MKHMMTDTGKPVSMADALTTTFPAVAIFAYEGDMSSTVYVVAADHADAFQKKFAPAPWVRMDRPFHGLRSAVLLTVFEG